MSGFDFYLGNPRISTICKEKKGEQVATGMRNTFVRIGYNI